jgi:hypothetical protein
LFLCIIYTQLMDLKDKNVRIGIVVAIVVLLLVAWKMGWFSGDAAETPAKKGGFDDPWTGAVRGDSPMGGYQRGGLDVLQRLNALPDAGSSIDRIDRTSQPSRPAGRYVGRFVPSTDVPCNLQGPNTHCPNPAMPCGQPWIDEALGEAIALQSLGVYNFPSFEDEASLRMVLQTAAGAIPGSCASPNASGQTNQNAGGALPGAGGSGQLGSALVEQQTGGPNEGLGFSQQLAGMGLGAGAGAGAGSVGNYQKKGGYRR